MIYVSRVVHIYCFLCTSPCFTGRASWLHFKWKGRCAAARRIEACWLSMSRCHSRTAAPSLAKLIRALKHLVGQPKDSCGTFLQRQRGEGVKVELGSCGTSGGTGGRLLPSLSCLVPSPRPCRGLGLGSAGGCPSCHLPLLLCERSVVQSTGDQLNEGDACCSWQVPLSSY